MRKLTALLSIAALAGAAASAAFWTQLRAERECNAELSARLQKVSAVPVTAWQAAPNPVVSPQPAPTTPPATAVNWRRC